MGKIYKIKGSDILIKESDLEEFTEESTLAPSPYGLFMYIKRYECLSLEVTEQHNTKATIITIRETGDVKRTVYSQAFMNGQQLQAEHTVEDCFEGGGDVEELVFLLREIEGEK